MAFLLMMGTRVVNSGMSLLWTRWLLGAMGTQLYGSFISFQAITSLGALGDLGLGGAVSVEANRLLGARKQEELKVFLASARAFILVLAVVATVIFASLSPLLPGWLGFANLPQGGSLTLLFLVGATILGGTILTSYTAALNYSCGNLTWPVLPSVVLAQVSLGLHLILALGGFPLWAQAVPTAGVAFGTAWMMWVFIRISHPELAALLPLRFGWAVARDLVMRSVWVYLWSLGYLVYTVTDRLLINRFFGPTEASHYYLNYKPTELAVFSLCSITFVSLTKIVQGHCSPDQPDRERAVQQTRRLNTVQVFLGSTAGIIYLALNGPFMDLWLGPGHRVPLLLQALFAANLAVTIGGDAGTKIAAQIDARGTRLAGIAVGTTALINLVLSFVAAKAGWIWGVALATLIAQSFFGLTAGSYTARQLGISRKGWMIKTWALPCAAIGLAFAVLLQPWPLWISGTALTAIILGVALLAGVNRQLLSEEMRIVRSMLGG